MYENIPPAKFSLISLEMPGVCINAVATFKLATVKDNLKEDQIWAGNSLRVIYTTRGEHFHGRDFSLVALKFSRSTRKQTISCTIYLCVH